ncbi:hypothetical protein [Streptomyces sp. NPDC001389]|uniref:hypothetical protein n=1 Tax=Streptomyces sp. NPDC001389 TaxID=3364569 RepID=UPI0036C64670
MAALIAAGGEVRAMTGGFQRMIIVDQKSLFVDDHVTRRPDAHSGWHVADRSSVMWARHIFDISGRTPCHGLRPWPMRSY